MALFISTFQQTESYSRWLPEIGALIMLYDCGYLSVHEN